MESRGGGRVAGEPVTRLLHASRGDKMVTWTKVLVVI